MSALEKVYRHIESEAGQWRGNSLINLPCPIPQLSGPQERKRWWGHFAKEIGSCGLSFLIDQAVGSEPGVALDIGCGSGTSAMHLLQKGWKVICVDYSPKAIEVVRNRAHRINQQWLETRQLELVCCNIENYKWPTKNVDLVLAGSSLSYFNPVKIRTIMENIYESLKVAGKFIGNFYVLGLVKDPSLVREMGAWFMPDKNSCRDLLEGHGYKTIFHDSFESSAEIVFLVGEKT